MKLNHAQQTYLRGASTVIRTALAKEYGEDNSYVNIQRLRESDGVFRELDAAANAITNALYWSNAEVVTAFALMDKAGNIIPQTVLCMEHVAEPSCVEGAVSVANEFGYDWNGIQAFKLIRCYVTENHGPSLCDVETGIECPCIDCRS